MSGSARQENNNDDDGDHLEAFCDPISFELMETPTILPCGHTFDKTTVEDWLAKDSTCPLCKEKCTKG